MFFADIGSGAFLSELQVGDLRPEPGAVHMGMPIQGGAQGPAGQCVVHGRRRRDRLHQPARPREVAFYDMAPFGPTGSDNWSACPYQGPTFRSGPGVPVYASDGVHNPNSARGFVVFRARVGRPSATVDHLNPQTMDG